MLPLAFDDVLPTKGDHVVEGKGLMEEGEEDESRRGMKTAYYHRNSKGVVIVYAEISFSTDVRVLFPNKEDHLHLRELSPQLRAPSAPQCLCES